MSRKVCTSSWMIWASLHYLPFSPSATIPKLFLFSYLFNFPEGKCCCVEWEPRVEVKAFQKAFCTESWERHQYLHEETPVQHSGTTNTGKGWGLQLMGVFLQWHLTVIFPYQKQSHTSLSFQPVINIYKKFRAKTYFKF